MSPSAKHCRRCVEEFDEDERCPRILKCFHTLCTSCLEQLIENGNGCCPFCDKGFKAKSADDIRVDRTTLEFMEYISRLVSEYDSSQERPTTSNKKKMKKKTQRERQNPVKVMMQQREIFAGHHQSTESHSIRTSFSEDGNDDDLWIAQLSSESQITQGYDDVEETCDAKCCRVCCEEFDATEGGSHSPRILKCFHSVCSVCLDYMIRNGNKKCPFCRRVFKASTTDDVSVNRTIVDFIEYINQLESRLFSSLAPDSESSYPSNGIEGENIYRIQNLELTDEYSPTHITADELLEMSDSTKQILEEGRLFAVQLLEGGRRRVARITKTPDEKLCLHHLTNKKKSWPSRVCFIQHEDVLKLMDPSSRLSFLEISVCGSTEGRLYIRLPNDTKGAQQFSLLCTGEEGPSYAYTNLLQIWSTGRNEERVLCGDYETNSGSGGKSLILGLTEIEETEEEYRKPGLAGTVVGGWELGDEVGAQFFIHTRDQPLKEVYPAFGMVEEGLEVLIKAVSLYPNIRYVSIQDCGLVLSC